MRRNTWDDHYARRARNEKWLARSVYKLQEIDGRFHLIRSGDRVLDLGCYPGSWSQYALKRVGPRGHVAGVDQTQPTHLNATNFSFIHADVLDVDVDDLIQDLAQRDVVMSDLAPRTTGIGTVDTARSLALARKALEIARALLKGGGHFLCKVFEGEDLPGFKSDVASCFQQVRFVKPQAVRKGSREIYVIGSKLVELVSIEK
jgi:23S rRNA (uridine2552-2'-O)-methyltransferase